MKRLAIIGLGLMGGSLGLALKARGFAGRVTGYTRSAERRQTALTRGAVDEVYDTPQAAVRDADVVVYCAPILAIPPLVRETLGDLKPGAILTDVGSTKDDLVGELTAAVKEAGAAFVGSHPIAGSEKQSIDAARPGLYEGATVVITPTGDEPDGVVAAVESLWKGTGALVYRMSPGDHDRMLARTSHLPHVAAALLVAAVARGGVAVSEFCGSGFRDTTRVAEGAPEIWMDILATNRVAVADELRALRAEIDLFIAGLDHSDLPALQRVLSEARQARRTICGRRAGVDVSG